ncbi:PQQ-binding-like beta-propeller repeat protein [Pedobacter xixiisoli]|uniref:PQQ-like domain-containing protein n=1 Tax=Pedobacter xixiisoli TaxID=1476464 RepID=A0A286AEN7_9SPHI|nr:PQQ-binding-like beta-propeller repeat protein [Pedobacter xixiisoli]SOD20360.1 PQQ-like domain-containing protein [Pedobacter xixiisoli]
MKKILTIALITASANIYAQQYQSIKLNEKIQTLHLESYTGNILTKDKNTIYGISQSENKIIWKINKQELADQSTLESFSKSLASLSSAEFLKQSTGDEDIEVIANSPFAKVVFDNNEVIINTVDGNVLYNAAKMNNKILSNLLIPDENSMLLLITKDKNIYFQKYNLKTKSIDWESKLASVESYGLKLKNAYKSLFGDGKQASVNENKVTVKDEYIYTIVNSSLYQLDRKTGNINWGYADPISDFFVSNNGEKVAIITNSGGLLSSKQNLNLLDKKTGNKLWKENITTKYFTYLEDYVDKILVAHASGFNFYGYNDGNKVWKKDAKGDAIKKVIPIDQDYLYIADREMNLIDKDGKNKWKKFVEIADKDDDQVLYLGKVENNRVFYLTDVFGNMVDYSTGVKIWKRNVEFDPKRPLVYSFDGTKFLVYNNKRIYTFNPNTKDDPKPKGKVDVENDKTISSIEAFDWGICIVGQNDVIGLDNDGNTIYQKTYKEPGEASRRLLKTGSIIGKGYFGTAASLHSAIANAQVVVKYRDANGNLVEETSDLLDKQTKDRLNKKADNQAAVASFIDDAVLSQVKNRFNGLKQNRDFAFILARGENGAELIKVNKRDGKELQKITLGSNKPLYEIDPVTGGIFYASENEIRVYR